MLTARRGFAVAAAAVLLAGGCSSSKLTQLSTSAAASSSAASLDGLSATQLRDRAKQALIAAKSFHLAGTTVSDGQPTTLDMGFSEHGADGTVESSDVKITLRSVNGVVYFQAPDSFWEKELASSGNAAQVLPLVSGKWVKVAPGDKNFSDFSTLANKQSFVDELTKDDSPSQTPSKAPGKTINGVDTLAVQTSDAVLYVDKSNARPIRIESRGDTTGDTGALTFSLYDSVPDPQVPPSSDVISSDQVQI